MFNSPQKSRGWRQGLYQTSASQKERIGAIRADARGNLYRYAKAGAADLNRGYMGLAAQSASDHVNEAVTAAISKGEQQLSLTVTAGTALAENQLQDGTFQIQDGTGEGLCVGIAGNSALGSGGTSIVITLERPLPLALDTTSEFSLYHSPWMKVVESATDENLPAGVPLVDVTLAYYYWAQTRGIANVYMGGSHAVGIICILGTTAGQVATIASSVDADVPIVGYKAFAAGASGEFGAVFLTID